MQVLGHFNIFKNILFHPLTNNMSSEIVLKLNIIVLLRPMFINKHSLEVVREKVCVGGQVKLEIPGGENKR